MTAEERQIVDNRLDTLLEVGAVILRYRFEVDYFKGQGFDVHRSIHGDYIATFSSRKVA